MSERPAPSMRAVVLPLLAAALLGGAVSAGVVSLLDDDGGGQGTSTTIVRQAPLAASVGDGAPDDDLKDGGGLSAADIYDRYKSGVVFVRADIVQRTDTPFDLDPGAQRSQSTGTGFVIDRDGDILTNNHVIAGASKVTVGFGDSSTVRAKVVGTDPDTDIALLRVDPKGLKLQPLALGSSKHVRVGDPTVAIGNPFGLDRTLTTGVISALQREITAPNGFSITNVIQTDAAINPGNSGGPLIDAAGQVIGINSQIETDSSGGSVGIGFAVPIDTAKVILDDLKTIGQVQRAYLGLTTVTVDATLAGLDLGVSTGVLVQTTTPGGPADKAGIRPGTISVVVENKASGLLAGGDVITRVDGRDILTPTQLAEVIAGHEPGDEVSVDLIRDGKPVTLRIELAKRPATVAPG